MRQPHAALLGTTFQYQAGYTSKHTSTRTSTHTSTHTCTHTHTHTHTHRHTHKHTHKQTHAIATPQLRRLHCSTAFDFTRAHMQKRLKRRCCIIARSSPGANASCNRSSSTQNQSQHIASSEPPSARAALHSGMQTERLNRVGVC